MKEAGNAREAEAEAQRAREQAELDRQAARRSLAVAKVTLADRARERRDWSGALNELELVPPEFRDARWHRVQRGSDNSIHPPIPLPEHIRTLTPHPLRPGVFIFNHRDIGMLDVRSGEQTSFFERPRIGFVAVSPDGEHLALIPEATGQAMEVVELETGRQLWTEPRAKNTFQAGFDPTGSLLFLASPDALRAVDWRQGRTVWEVRGIFGAKVIDRPGLPLISAGEKLQGFDPKTGQRLFAYPEQTPARHAAMNADGTRLVCRDRKNILWACNLQTGEKIFQTRLDEGNYFDLEFLPDGRHFLLGFTPLGSKRSYSVEVRQTETGRMVQLLTGGISITRGVAVHPLSGHVFANAVPRLWHPELKLPLLAHPADTRQLGPHPSGVNAWDFVDNQRLVYVDPGSDSPA
ncbi:MAG: WD40 repeat domain-containing protein [Limisphaerales bacterium]